MTETIAPTITDGGLLEMAQAVRRAGILCAGLELDVFDGLADGPVRADELAVRLATHPRGTRVLLNALAAIGMVRTDGDSYWLAPGADGLLVRSSPRYFGHALRLAISRQEWEALGHLAEAVRSGGTVLDTNAETPGYAFWEDLARNPTRHTPMVARLLADVLEPWAQPRARIDVLDVACGHGLYGFTVAQRYPQAWVRSTDWANVLEVTAGHAGEMGVSDRVTFVPGDMFEVSLGGPYDLSLITNVLHHFSAARVAVMLRRLAAATRPGGKLGIVAVMADETDPAANPVPHLFSALMLAWTREGESHSLATYRRLLTDCGFSEPEVHELPAVPLRLLLADRV